MSMRRGGMLAVLALLCLTGCSFAGLVYDRADWLVQREVGKYLSLTDVQSDALRAAVLDWQQWHRREALLRWQADALSLAAAVEAPLTEQQVINWGLLIEAHALDALDQTLVRLVPIMTTLTDDQIAEFWQSFDEARGERRKDRGMDAESVFDRANKLMRRWAGRPDARQQDLIQAWANRRAERWATGGEAQAVANDAERREQINGLLAQRDAADALAKWRRFLGVDPSSPLGSETMDADERALVSLLAELTATLTPRQRDRLRSRLQRYAKQFGNLASAD